LRGEGRSAGIDGTAEQLLRVQSPFVRAMGGS